jgi:hypothetical protein
VDQVLARGFLANGPWQHRGRAADDESARGIGGALYGYRQIMPSINQPLMELPLLRIVFGGRVAGEDGSALRIKGKRDIDKVQGQSQTARLGIRFFQGPLTHQKTLFLPRIGVVELLQFKRGQAVPHDPEIHFSIQRFHIHAHRACW